MDRAGHAGGQQYLVDMRKGPLSARFARLGVLFGEYGPKTRRESDSAPKAAPKTHQSLASDRRLPMSLSRRPLARVTIPVRSTPPGKLVRPAPEK